MRARIQKDWSLRDFLLNILSEMETVSAEELDTISDREIEERDEFVCDLPEDLMRLFCLNARYFKRAGQIVKDYKKEHHIGPMDLCEDAEYEDVHRKSLLILRQGHPICNLFWTLAKHYADVQPGLNVAVRKGGVLVSPRIEDENGLTNEEFLENIFGEEPE